MYICESCYTQISAGQCAYTKTIQTRKKVYPQRIVKHANGKDKLGGYQSKNYTVIDKGGEGFETVREIQVCERCAKIP